MAGRYYNKESTFNLLALASAPKNATTFIFGPESCPFDNVTLWLRGTGVAWSIDYVDVNGNAIGSAVASGTYAGGAPAVAWFVPAMLPPTIRPRLTLTNSTASAIVVTATWIGLSSQPNA